MKNYKKTLIIWISIGVLIGGYLIIEPIRHKSETRTHDKVTGVHTYTSEYVDGNEGYKVLLVTIAGSILIGGLGYLKANKKS